MSKKQLEIWTKWLERGVSWESRPRSQLEAAAREGEREICALAEEGSKLHRPEANYLRDGVYELRAKSGRVNLRVL